MVAKKGLSELLAAQGVSLGAVTGGPADTTPGLSLKEQAQRAADAAAHGLSQPAEEQAPPPPPAPAAKPARARGGKAAGKLKAVPDPPPAGVWDLVVASHNSAVDHPSEWVDYSMRIPPSVAAALKDRLRLDQARTRLWSLAARHYINAALSRVPEDIEAAGELGLQWRQEHRGEAAKSPSGNGLHQDVELQMRLLSAGLSSLPAPVRLWEISAAAIQNLLNDLAATDGS